MSIVHQFRGLSSFHKTLCFDFPSFRSWQIEGYITWKARSNLTRSTEIPEIKSPPSKSTNPDSAIPDLVGESEERRESVEEPRGGRGKLEESLKRKTFNVGNIQTRTVGWPVKGISSSTSLFSLIDYLFN